jgi:hypothetical protein
VARSEAENAGTCESSERRSRRSSTYANVGGDQRLQSALGAEGEQRGCWPGP